MPRHRPESHHFQHVAERLRRGGHVLDELDAIQAERIGIVAEGFLQRLPVLGRQEKVAHVVIDRRVGVGGARVGVGFRGGIGDSWGQRATRRPL